MQIGQREYNRLNDAFAKVDVYDAQDLQRKVMEYGEQMTPVVRTFFTGV